MKKLILTCAAAALLAGAASAQISIGPEVGVNLSSYYGKAGGEKVTGIDAIAGLHIGAVADVPLASSIYFQPGIFYTRNGYDSKTYDPTTGYSYNVNVRVSTIEIPLNFFYKTGVPGGNRFFVGVGPYVGINVGGFVKLEDFGVKQDISIGSSAGSNDIKRLDVGGGISAGYELAMGVFIHAHYQRGFTNLQPGGDSDNTFKNMNYGLSVGYLFSGNGKKMKKHTVKKA